MPRLSVITPTKNRLPLLRAALDSVAEQTFADWEHLVIDDGSDDGTRQEVEARANADPRVRYVQRQGATGGANVCRNLGIRMANGEFVIFLDSDDLLDPHCLEARIGVMARNSDLDFVTFQTGIFEKVRGDVRPVFDPQLVGDDLLRFLYFEAPWIITAPIWRKDSLIRLGLFDESLPSWQDIDLHVRAVASGLKYIRLPEVDHHVRWQCEATKVSVEQRRSPKHLEAAESILAKFEDVVRQGPGMSWTRQRALCSLYFFVAENWIRIGRTGAGLRTWARIRERGLGPWTLYATGALLLGWGAIGGPLGRFGERVAHKWKGWMRLRYEPELVRV